MLHLLDGYHQHYGEPPVPIRHFNFKKDYKADEWVRSKPRKEQYFTRQLSECAHFVGFVHQHRNSPYPQHMIEQALSPQRLSLSVPVSLPQQRLS